MEEKKRNLTKTKGKGEDAINDMILDQQDKRVSLQNDFGSAIKALQRAEAHIKEEECEFEFQVRTGYPHAM